MNGLKGSEIKSQKKGNLSNNNVSSQIHVETFGRLAYTAEESKEDDEDEDLIVHSPSQNPLVPQAQKNEKDL